MSIRIRELRERLNLNQEELGRKVDVTRQTIAAWEKGQREPSMAQLTKVAHALEVPVELLLHAELSPSAQGNVHVLYRADKHSALREIDKAIMTRKAKDYAFVEKKVGELSWLPESRPLYTYESHLIEQVAQETRDSLGVENAPLGNALGLLERRGLKIIKTRLPENVFGFSAYSEDWGAIAFINQFAQDEDGGLKELPYERQVFTAFHELGHLIFHRREYREPTITEGKKDDRERIANHFAGAVLVPAQALQEDLGHYKNRWLPIPLLCDLKIRYGVSVGTLLYRASDLGIISRRQRGQQFGQLKKLYPDTYGEPSETKCQPYQTMSRLERLVFYALMTEQISESRAAEILDWRLQRVRDQLEHWLQETVAL